MSLVQWDPFRDVAELQNRINRMFDETFGRSRDLSDEVNQYAWRPAVDIYESQNSIVFLVELPGISKENVSVEVKDNVLTFKGERPVDPNIQEKSYYRKERRYGTFQRSFTLQQTIQPNFIKATFRDGVLSIDIPKHEEEQPKQITVDVE